MEYHIKISELQLNINMHESVTECCDKRTYKNFMDCLMPLLKVQNQLRLKNMSFRQIYTNILIYYINIYT